MALPVIWAPEALDDLEAIGDFIARDSRFFAVAVVERIFATGEALSEFPLSGRLVQDGGVPGLREKIVYSYRLIYRVDSELVAILACIHGRRRRNTLRKRISPKS